MKHFNEDAWELLQDDHFIAWVLFPDPENSLYWKQWMEQHPERIPVLTRAREIVIAMRNVPQMAVGQDLLKEVYANVEERILAGTREKGISVKMTPVKRHFPYKWIGAAAALLAGVIALAFFLRQRGDIPAAVALDSHMEKDQLIRTNRSALNQVAYLTDGSTVVLKSGTSIHHNTFLENKQREVFLKGDAFFDVAKDAGRPFVVYTPKVAIRVLGTSFTVKEGKNGALTIIVKTGKIAVCNRAGKDQSAHIVTPDHKIYFDPVSATFTAASINAAEAAENIQLPAARPYFVFEDKPVNEIFDALETAYSIKINRNEVTLGKCRVTTNITNETFENKLKIVCAAINATYEVRGGQVYIQGRPCM